MRIKIYPEIWLTADTHFFHNFMAETIRGFGSAHEMNAELIRRWNAKVGPKDTVYHLGDFALAPAHMVLPILDQLNFAQIFLLRGNHDGWLNREAKGRFQFVKDYHYAHLGDRRAVLCHYAFRSWNNAKHGVWNLHGHSHGNLPELQNLQTDVGVDSWDLAPVHMDELTAHFEGRSNDLEDHHAQPWDD